MIKRALAVAGASALVLGTSMGAASAAGNAYGKEAGACVAALGVPSLGAGIQAGKMAHEGAMMTAETIAMSVRARARAT